MLLEIKGIKYLATRGERLVARQHWPAGFKKPNHSEGSQEDGRENGGESQAVGRCNEASQAKTALGLAVFDQRRVGRQVEGESSFAERATTGGALATFVAPLREIADGSQLEMRNSHKQSSC